MKLRVLALLKSLLAVGLLMGLPGPQGGPNPTEAPPELTSISPQPILAQIGEDFPVLPEKEEAESPVANDMAEAQEQGVDLSPAALAVPPKLSPGVDEVVQLARAQLSEEVLLAYIENSPARFNLRAQDILYLHDVGISAQVIAAMIRHDQDLPVPAWDTAAEVVTAPTDAEPYAEGAETSESEPPTAVAVTTAPEPATESTVTHNHFYNTLAPYGSWMELPDYGWCWRPTVAVVDRSWRPYAHGGRWIYTDSGWYWHSYYSWGWAPFHYGRWHLSSGYGWVWAPDTHWGPAWVTWRYCDGYYGWAPLPPGAVYRSGIGLTYYGTRVSFGFGFGFSSACYTFVPVRHFYSRRPWNYCVPHGHVGPIYNNSTVINNYGDGNNTVVNVGPGTGAVTAATRTEIQKVKVRDIAPGEARLVRAESLSRDGTTLNVYRPRLPEQATTPPAEITRRQQELQTRSREMARSEAVQAAVVRARVSERVLSPNLANNPRTGAQPSAAPRVAGDGATGSRAEPQARREPAARSSGPATAPTTLPSSRVNPGTRTEPQQGRRATEPTRGSVQPQRAPTQIVSPQQPARQPTSPRSGSSSPTPRIEPARPTQVTPAPVAPRSRIEPPRTVNPAYAVAPNPPTQLTPRPATGIPSPASPNAIAPRSYPVPQRGVPRSEVRSLAPQASPAPARMAPSRTFSAPAPSRAPTPSVVPSRPSGSVARPAPSPARPQAAPSSAPRSGGTRNR